MPERGILTNADIARTRPQHCINNKGTFLGFGSLFGRNDRGDLRNKAGPALESYVAPQPSHRNYETVPDAD